MKISGTIGITKSGRDCSRQSHTKEIESMKNILCILNDMSLKNKWKTTQQWSLALLTECVKMGTLWRALGQCWIHRQLNLSLKNA